MRSSHDLPSIEELDLKHKRVLIRVDFNVPLDQGRVADDTRIRAAIPTIQYALNEGAKVILVSHLGRPKGKVTPALTLAPAGEVLAGLLDMEVKLSDRPIGEAPTRLVQDLRDGEVILLENIRFHSGEIKNSEGLSRELALLTEVYINDAFGTAHRAHASTSGITAFIHDDLGVGLLMKREVDALTALLRAPRKGLVAVLGGAKVSDKIGVLNTLIPKAESVLIGGAMAYTFLAAQGIDVGLSRVQRDHLETARALFKLADQSGTELLLPNDHLCATSFEPNEEAQSIDSLSIPSDLMGLDIGPKTIERFSAVIRQGEALIWNGPMGVFEWPQFSKGTFSIAEAFSQTEGYTVIGGGDSVRAIHESGHAGDVDHISTGGGASLEFLEGKMLPGIAAMIKRASELEAERASEAASEAAHIRAQSELERDT
jgi:phosphoglycerate kinase